MRKIPMRSCIMCREKKEKRALIRIIRDEEGHVSFDPTGKRNGRGAYICNGSECVEAVKNKGKMDKALNTNCSAEELENTYNQIKKYLGEYKNKEEN